MKYNIAVIKGDGIGPEVVDQTIRVLDVVAEKFGFELDYKEYLAGGCAIDEVGTPLPQETVEGAKSFRRCTSRSCRRRQVGQTRQRYAS